MKIRAIENPTITFKFTWKNLQLCNKSMLFKLYNFPGFSIPLSSTISTLFAKPLKFLNVPLFPLLYLYFVSCTVFVDIQTTPQMSLIVSIFFTVWCFILLWSSVWKIYISISNIYIYVYICNNYWRPGSFCAVSIVDKMKVCVLCTSYVQIFLHILMQKDNLKSNKHGYTDTKPVRIKVFHRIIPSPTVHFSTYSMRLK